MTSTARLNVTQTVTRIVALKVQPNAQRNGQHIRTANRTSIRKRNS